MVRYKILKSQFLSVSFCSNITRTPKVNENYGKNENSTDFRLSSFNSKLWNEKAS